MQSHRPLPGWPEPGTGDPATCRTAYAQLPLRAPVPQHSPEVGDMTETTERTPLFHGNCVRVQMDRDRYETCVVAPDRDEADGQSLAAAQFYPSRSDGQGVTGWIVSGTSSDHYSTFITSRYEALKLLHEVTRAERVLLRRYPQIYPQVPPVAHEQIRRDFPELHRLNQSG